MENVFFCIECKKVFRIERDALACGNCGKKYPIIENIPVFIENLDDNQMTNKEHTDNIHSVDLAKEEQSFIRDYSPDQPSQIFLKLFGKKIKFKRLLDLGCGPGQLSLSLLKDLDIADELCGLDISLNSLKAFKENLYKNNIDKKISLVCSTAEKIYFPDGYFDVVVCHKFIHHIPLSPVLNQVQRILSEGGYFVCFREPYLNNSLTIFRRVYNSIINRNFLSRESKDATTKFLYSKSHVEKLARENNFTSTNFYFSKYLFPFVKVVLSPFIIKFPKLRRFLFIILVSTYKIDVLVLGKVLHNNLTQQFSFFLKKKGSKT